MKILLVGAGAISKEYAKALRSLGQTNISILSRNRESAQRLCQDFGLRNAYGGAERAFERIVSDFDAAVVAVPIENLTNYLEIAGQQGSIKTLVEKPVSLSSQTLAALLARLPNINATVALNRLYFPSIIELRKRLRCEQVTSADFSFTEWIHRIDASKYDEGVLRRWGVANCVHVISTVFDLIGFPRQLYPFRSGAGEISWHPSGATFSGAGITTSGTPFTYLSDWLSAGRWSLTVRTTFGRYDCTPMESLTFCPRGSLSIETIVPPYAGAVKCGFREMLDAWLHHSSDAPLVELRVLVEHIRWIENIFRYEAMAADKNRAT